MSKPSAPEDPKSMRILVIQAEHWRGKRTARSIEDLIREAR